MVEFVEFNSVEFWIYISSALSLLIICSITSALNSSFLELDATHLEILHRSGTPIIQNRVNKAQALLKHHHLVIFSLVLLHAAADEALPILLSYVTPNEYTAIAVAVPLVLLFGELLPAIITSGRSLTIIATLSPIIWLCVGIAGIITGPLAYIAHHIAGEDSKMNIRSYRRNEIAEFLRLHIGIGKNNMSQLHNDDNQSLLEENLLSDSRRESYDIRDYDDEENNNENNNSITSKYMSKRNLLSNNSSSSSIITNKPILTELNNTNNTEVKLNIPTPNSVTLINHRNEKNAIPNFTTDKPNNLTTNHSHAFTVEHRHSGDGISMTVRSSPPASATPSTSIPNQTLTLPSTILSSTEALYTTPSTVTTTINPVHPHSVHLHSGHPHFLPRTESNSTTQSINTVETSSSRNNSFDDMVVVRRTPSAYNIGNTNSIDHTLTIPHHHHSHEHHPETHTSHHTTSTIHAHQTPSLPPLIEEKPKHHTTTADTHTKHPTTAAGETIHPHQHHGFLKRWMSKHKLNNSGNNSSTEFDASGVNSGGSDYESSASHTSARSKKEESDTRNSVGLTAHEVRVIEGTLGLAVRTVSMRMVPINKLFAISSDDILTRELLHKITSSAHSRIPVYEGTNRNSIVGLLLVKLLLSIDDFGVGVHIGSLPLIRPIVIDPDTTMLDALKAFEKGKSHMAIVTKQTIIAEEALSKGLPLPSFHPTPINNEGTSENSDVMTTQPSTDNNGVEVLGIVTLEDCLLEVLNAGTGHSGSSSHHHHHHHHHSNLSANHHHSTAHSHHHSSNLPRPHSIRTGNTTSSGLKREASSGILSSMFSSLTGTNTPTNSNADHDGSNNSSSRASPIVAEDGNIDTTNQSSSHHNHHHSHTIARSRGNSVSGLHGSHNQTYSVSPVPTDEYDSSSSHHHTYHHDVHPHHHHSRSPHNIHDGSHPIPIPMDHHQIDNSHNLKSSYEPENLASPPSNAPVNLISDAHEMRALLKHWEKSKSHRNISTLHHESSTSSPSSSSTPNPVLPIPESSTMNNTNQVGTGTEPSKEIINDSIPEEDTLQNQE